MDKTQYTLNVSSEITDAELEKKLADVLPFILQHKFNVNEIVAKNMAPGLAKSIVQRIRACSETNVANHYLRDISPAKVQVGSQPSKEVCDQFQKDLADVVNVRYGGKAYHGMSKVEKIAGTLWSYILERVGPSWEEQERKERAGGSAVAGVRG
jgi:hypothetical protein